MSQNSWPVQVYCFAWHNHREHGIPPIPASQLPLQVGARPIFRENLGNDTDLFLVSLIPLCGLFKSSLLRTYQNQHHFEAFTVPFSGVDPGF